MSDQPPPDELVFTRVFEAPRELVFRCMTEPEHLTHFWGPAGVSTPLENIKVDLRPGGAFETVMVSDADGSQYAMRAVYVEVAAPFEMTLPGISKHLKVLERCGLISRTRSAQFRPCHLEREALDAVADWIGENQRIWSERFDKLGEHLRSLQEAPARSATREPGGTHE